MKKKILCGIIFLTILFCISFSQTYTSAADAAVSGPISVDISGADSVSEDAPSSDTVSGDASGSEPFSEDASDPEPFSGRVAGVDPSTWNGHSVVSLGELRVPLADLVSGATPAPLNNTAASAGEYILSLTTSIGTLTYYNQSDSRWADFLYGGTDPMSVYGCGPTVLAMLVNSFTENTCQPPDMAAWAAANHYWSSGFGTKHEFIPEGAAAFGLRAEPFRDLTAESVISELKSGHILVALMGPGHFSDSGHFIIITEDWSGNQVRVADPARLERTQTAWDVQLILDELLTSATAGGPVWSITPK